MNILAAKTESHFKPEVGSERGFGIVFTVFFSIVGIWPLLFGHGVLRLWAVALALVFFAITLLRPGILKPLNLLWFKFGLLLGKVIAPLVMLLVYFLAVVPTAVAIRLFGKDLLRLNKPPESQTSLWIDRLEAGGGSESMTNQF